MVTISFFSYKGGSGRSSLCYNTLPFLAQKIKATKEHPLIVVDLDVDSCGLSILLGSNAPKEEESVPVLTTNRILSAEDDLFKRSSMEREKHVFTELDVYNRFESIGNKLATGLGSSVLFIPVKTGEKIGNTFNDSSNNTIGNFIRACRNYGASGVIFDTPAGDQVVGRGAINHSNQLIVCLRITKQHREGTADFLKRKIKDISNRKIILVPNAVPDVEKEIYIDGVKYNFEAVKQNMIKRYGSIVTESNNDNVFIDGMLKDGFYGIPEVQRFKFEEGNLYSIKHNISRADVQLTSDEQKAYDGYEHLADLIVANGEN